jgi:hypothetical protein
MIRGLNSTNASPYPSLASTGREEILESETPPNQITAVLGKNKAISLNTKVLKHLDCRIWWYAERVV